MAGDFLKVGDARRSEVREAVAAHRAAKRDEIRREEAAAAGRRLTAAELFELRQQVRGQWTPPGTPPRAMNSAESQPAERIAPPPMSAARALTLPRSQRR